MMLEPPVVIDPQKWPRTAKLPALGLIPGGCFTLQEVAREKKAQGIPVHLAFPVGRAQEAANLRHLLDLLQPLLGRVLDRIWIAFGGRRPEALMKLAGDFQGVEVLWVPEHLPPDQHHLPLGKGAAMRALLHHLVIAEGLSHPRSLVQFLDADIRPAYFGPWWVLDPVGVLLRFSQPEAVKLVYHRPRGGRLNAMLRSLLALCPHPRVQSLQQLAYLLSGEMAGTLRFWLQLPFKTGYGIEIFTLLNLAFNRVGLSPGQADLDLLLQVHVGQMDHRHAPLTSTAQRRGLDQMAAAVFATFLEVLEEEKVLSWHPEARESLALLIPQPVAPGHRNPQWLRVTVKDATLPPLASLGAVQEQPVPRAF